MKEITTQVLMNIIFKHLGQLFMAKKIV